MHRTRAWNTLDPKHMYGFAEVRPSPRSGSVEQSPRSTRRRSSLGFGVLSTALAEAKMPTMEGSEHLRCASSHPLVAYMTRHGRHTCDGCGARDVPKGSLMFRCHECDWDLCATCSASRVKELGVADHPEEHEAAKCPDGHALLGFSTRHGRHWCDACGVKGINKGSVCMCLSACVHVKQ